MLIRQPGGVIRRRLGAGIALGLMTGMAVGQNVTIPWPTVTYKGSVEVRATTGDGICTGLYTVPSGLKLRVTSVLLATSYSTIPIHNQYLCGGNKTACLTPRTNFLTAPVDTTASLALTSGILFNQGEVVYVCNGAVTGYSSSWTLYGFLYR